MKLYFKFGKWRIGIVPPEKPFYHPILDMPVQILDNLLQFNEILGDTEFVSLDIYPSEIQLIKGEIGNIKGIRMLLCQ